MSETANATLVVLASSGAVALVALTWRRGYETRTALGVGALVASAVLIKTAAIAVVPLLTVGALGPLWTRGTVTRRYLAWLAQAVIVAAVLGVPWMLWSNR